MTDEVVYVGPRVAVSNQMLEDMGYDIGRTMSRWIGDASDRLLHPLFGPQQPYPVGPPEPSFDYCTECGHGEWTPGFRHRPRIAANR